jgi:hypothetical protein
MMFGLDIIVCLVDHRLIRLQQDLHDFVVIMDGLIDNQPVRLLPFKNHCRLIFLPAWMFYVVFK